MSNATAAGEQFHVRDLVVIGAGPKGVAIAAKLSAISRLSIRTPDVEVIEMHRPGAHWSGLHGYTSGQEILGTRPEKDIGYPYTSSLTFGPIGSAIDAKMRHFSWQSYLVNTSQYADWVDRGCPPPTHHAFSVYLAWCLNECGDVVDITHARVDRIDFDEPANLWKLHVTGGSVPIVYARALVVTGPGQQRQFSAVGAGERALVFAASERDVLTRSMKIHQGAHVGIVGAGESGASAAIAALSGGAGKVTLVSRRGMRRRDESPWANAKYSGTSNTSWDSMAPTEKAEFIARTDRGVISVAAYEVLHADDRVSSLKETVADVRNQDSRATMVCDSGAELPFDLVVNATGFDPWAWTWDLLSTSARAAVERVTDGNPPGIERIAASMDASLKVAGLSAPLFVPSIAAQLVGPGLSNLSCLGLVSDAIVHDVVKRARPAASLKGWTR